MSVTSGPESSTELSPKVGALACPDLSLNAGLGSSSKWAKWRLATDYLCVDTSRAE